MENYGFLCSHYDPVNQVTDYYDVLNELVLQFWDYGNFWFVDFENDQACSYYYDDDTTTCVVYDPTLNE